MSTGAKATLRSLLTRKPRSRAPTGYADDAARRAKLLKRLESFAWWMDRSIGIPGTRWRLGLDSILGIFPVGGDVATAVVQALAVAVAHREFDLPRPLIARMMGNVLLDTAVGAIPILGDLFDVHFKANTRNVALLKEHLAQRVAHS